MVLIRPLLENICSIPTQYTDNEIWSGISKSARNPKSSGHIHAKRIVEREHFKVAYERNPRDIDIDSKMASNIFSSLVEKYGKEKVRFDSYTPSSMSVDFPVLMNDSRIENSFNISDALDTIPLAQFQYVFVENDIESDAREQVQQIISKSEAPLLEFKQ